MRVYHNAKNDTRIGRTFSPRATAVNEILRRLEAGSLRQLATLEAGVADVFEAKVSSGSSAVVGKPLSEVELPEHALVAVIQREGKAIIPGAQDTLEAGDIAVIIAPAKARRELKAVFTG